MDYVLGGFFFDEKIKSNSIYNQEFVLPIQSYTHKTTSWALFGQLTGHVTDRLRLVGGARYTHDHKDMNGMINNFITFCGGAPDGVAPELITPPASFAYGCANSGALPRYADTLSTGSTIDWLKSNGWISSSATDQANVQLFDLTTGKGHSQDLQPGGGAGQLFARDVEGGGGIRRRAALAALCFGRKRLSRRWVPACRRAPQLQARIHHGLYHRIEEPLLQQSRTVEPGSLPVEVQGSADHLFHL
jgi:hypothetical protein